MSQPRLFGTDGIRGAFGAYPLDEATVRRLGRALGRRLGKGAHVVLGGDTRDSTPELGRWLAEGLGSEVRASFLGTVPTPAVAQATRALAASCGVAISASHNPHPDNGIKLIDGEGFKWPTSWEAALEADLEGLGEVRPEPVRLVVDTALVRGYLRSVTAILENASDQAPLSGFAVALDAGNGAASAYAEEVFSSLGARVTLVHAEPDGENINSGCGSTHPEVIAALVRTSASDVGFSFDGDADRVILADEDGTVRDGDAILYLWARDLAARGELPGNRIVATSMSNLGLEVALGQFGVSVVRCDVGDRVVVETMRREGAVLGGEQSGHVVHLGLGTTGDGLLTAVMMASLAARPGRSLTRLLEGFERFPQLIKNVRVGEKTAFEQLPAVTDVRRRVEEELEGSGRLVLRYSGTEPLARIMIEGRDHNRIEALARELAVAISTEIGE